MLDITKDIQSLTAFRRRSGDFMKLLKKRKRPLVLTVRGKAAAVVQDAAAYQRLLDVVAGPTPKKVSVKGWRMHAKDAFGLPASSSASSKRSMEYAVNLTARAERDLANLYEGINAEHSEAVRKWLPEPRRRF